MEVLYEDNHLLIVNKPAGMPVQRDESGDESLIDVAKKYIKKKYHKQGAVFVGLPHRLDRPVSGIVILARTSKALERLNKMFQQHKIKKIYWAIVEDMPPSEEGYLTHYILRNPQNNTSKAFNKPVKGAKKAQLNYKFIGATKNYYLLEIELLTGRHHQIRAQLAKIKCHIKGDLKYGAKRSNKGGGIHLHARRVTFVHPVKQQEINIIAPVPNDNLWQIFKDF